MTNKAAEWHEQKAETCARVADDLSDSGIDCALEHQLTKIHRATAALIRAVDAIRIAPGIVANIDDDEDPHLLVRRSRLEALSNALEALNKAVSE